MADEGQFHFTNGIVIDEFIVKDRVLDVVNHEFTHNILYTSTSYGQIVLMLEKNGIFDEKSCVLKDTLYSYMGRMQERVAVNIELMLKCVSNGFEEYFDAIESLKMRNNSYYNHFRKLCCINGKINEEKDAEQLSKILREIARFALNVDLTQIPFKSFESEKDIIRFFNDSKNNARYAPNKRFEILINVLFRNNKNNNDFDSVYEGGISMDKMDDMEYIHNLTMDAIKDLYSGHPFKDRLVNRVESVGKKKTLYFEGAELLAVKPAKINEDRTHYIKYVESLDDFISLLKMQEKQYVYILHRIRGLEDFQGICIFEEKNNRRISHSFFFVEEGYEKLFDLLRSLDCNFVFYKTKFLSKESKSVRKMVRRLPIYLFEDTPLLNSLEVIGNMFYGGTYCFIRRERDTVVVIQKRSICLFANIVVEAEEILARELGNFSIKFNEINDNQKSEILYLDKMCNDYEGNSIEDGKVIE